MLIFSSGQKRISDHIIESTAGFNSIVIHFSSMAPSLPAVRLLAVLFVDSSSYLCIMRGIFTLLSEFCDIIGYFPNATVDFRSATIFQGSGCSVADDFFFFFFFLADLEICGSLAKKVWRMPFPVRGRGGEKFGSSQTEPISGNSRDRGAAITVSSATKRRRKVRVK